MTVRRSDVVSGARRPAIRTRGLALLLAAPLALLSACGGEPPAETGDSAAELSVQRRYIVVLKDDAMGGRGDRSRAPQSAQRLSREHRAQLGHVYTLPLNGFSAEMSDEDMRRMSQDPDVRYIEPDGIVTAVATAQQPNPPSWGLARISTRALNLASPFIYPATGGRGVTVFVLDTGLQFSHRDFGGRASLVKTFYPGETAPDGNGHGTHVAGTIGSMTYGVAKNVTLKGVKVLNAAGSGTYADVVAGIQFVAAEARKLSGQKAVMNLSLGGPRSQAVNDAVDGAVAAGVVAIVAAGNNGGDACTLSPSGAARAFAVGATDRTDTRPAYSNIGACVKVFAPGNDITSLWKGADGARNTISGTSMAAPHVAGVAALFMADKSYATVQQVYDDLIRASTKNVVRNQGAGSPRSLAFSQNIAN